MKKTTFLFLNYFSMGLFDFFTSNTVESKYRELLTLFRQTHRTFTIVRNEKCIVEFTYGINDKLQYGSIEQHFDEPKQHITNSWTYDPSKFVTITMSVKIEGKEVQVIKSFEQSYNQTMMYNIVTKEFLEQAFSTMRDVYADEIQSEET